MRFITAIVIIALSDAAVSSPDFGDRITRVKSSNANSVRQQSDPNEYLSLFNIHQQLEKLQSILRDSQQKNEMNYTLQPSSLTDTPLNISFSASEHSLSMPHSTPQSTSQQSSLYVPQSFNGSTFYNPQSNQLTFPILLPLNCSESSPTCLTPQPLLFSLPAPKAFRSSRDASASHGASVGGSNGVLTEYTENNVVYTADIKPTAFQKTQTVISYLPPSGSPGSSRSLGFSSGYSGLSGFPGFSRPLESVNFTKPLEISSFSGLSGFLIPSQPLGPSGFPGSTKPSEFPRPSEPSRFLEPAELSGIPSTTTRRPFSSSFTPNEIGVSINVGTTEEVPRLPETKTSIPSTGTRITTQADDDLHPPHIHSLDVECSKTMMTINIEFNRVFDGIIYSKGYYANPECTYVKQNSGSTRYSFTVNLNSCGTQFINDFAGAGQAYLENVLVLQNEPDVQEVWDTVRGVQCLWEGNINKALTVNLSVDILKPDVAKFDGDTAIAKLDIQIGKGPFAPAADGLVKIGEIMTLVVSVEGDPDFDLQVRDCLARDEISSNMLQLTDNRGCILKPKLFGAFQKTKDTGNTGASIIAYAFFQAFKFPDVLDLFIECNVELCKTNCEPCPDVNQQIEPGRRRRSVTYAQPSSNSTNSILLSDPVRIGRRFKVIMLDDISVASSQILDI